MIKEVPDKLQDLKYREQKIWKLVDLVMGGKRLVELIGLPGVGKSSVARHAVHYMMARKHFTGGIIMINLRNDRSFTVLMRKIKMVLINKLKLRHSAKRDEVERADFDEFVKILKDFFQQKDDDLKIKHAKRVSYNKPKFLLCFDNAEEVIQSKKDGDEFRLFLAQMVDFCPNLSTVVTSNKPLGELPGHVAPETQILSQLKAQEAVELFVDNAGEIDAEDIYKLILEDDNYPLDKLENKPAFPAKIAKPVTPEMKKSILGYLKRDYKFCKNALTIHDLFHHLAGNPLSIKMLASFHKNSLMKGNDLATLYKRVKSESDQIENFSDRSQRPYSKFMNNISLKMSTESSMQMLQTS